MARIPTSSTTSSSRRSDPRQSRSARRPALAGCGRGAAQVAFHADGRLDTLVITGNASELAVAERGVEGARGKVAGTQLQSDGERPGRERGLLEPVHQPPGDTAAAMARRDREQVEVGAVIAVAHDGEARAGTTIAGFAIM